MLVGNTHGPRRCTVRTDKNLADVTKSVRLNPGTLTSQLFQQLNISRTSLMRIFHKDLALLAYKVQLFQQVTRPSAPFSLLILSLRATRNGQRFSGEAIFISVAMSKNRTAASGDPKTNTWSSRNQYIFREWQFVEFGVMTSLAHFFFENIGERSRGMTNDFLRPKIEDMNLDDF